MEIMTSMKGVEVKNNTNELAEALDMNYVVHEGNFVFKGYYGDKTVLIYTEPADKAQETIRILSVTVKPDSTQSFKALDRELVKQAIRECKKAAGLDYAYSAGLSDCMTCTNYAISQKHGVTAKGIWLKWYRVGMNSSKWGERETYCIVHDLTDAQAETVTGVLRKYFKVEWDGDEGKCIEISAKEGAM